MMNLLTATLNPNTHLSRRLFAVLVTFLALAVSIYLYFLAITIGAAVARGDAERQSEDGIARLAPLETQYVARVGAIDIEFTQKEGFVEAVSPRYIAVGGGSSGGLTLRSP